MLIGIVSDSHDRAQTLATAINALGQRGAQFLIHCGDLCDPSLLDHLAGIPAAFVWGNCDWDRLSLQRYAERIGVDCHGAYADLTLDEKRLAVIHGDDSKRKQSLLTAQEHDYLIHGHSHQREDLRVGRTRIINPGALHRANPRSAALLDTTLDQLIFLTIEG